jgi:hypothetical protein
MNVLEIQQFLGLKKISHALEELPVFSGFPKQPGTNDPGNGCWK